MILQKSSGDLSWRSYGSICPGSRLHGRAPPAIDSGHFLQNMGCTMSPLRSAKLNINMLKPSSDPSSPYTMPGSSKHKITQGPPIHPPIHHYTFSMLEANGNVRKYPKTKNNFRPNPTQAVRAGPNFQTQRPRFSRNQ